MINEFLDLNLTCDDDELLPDTDVDNFNTDPPYGFNGQQTCPFTTGRDFPVRYDMDGYSNNEKGSVVLYLIIILVVYFLLALWAMVFKAHELGDQEEVPKFDVAVAQGAYIDDDDDNDDGDEEEKDTHKKAESHHAEGKKKSKKRKKDRRGTNGMKRLFDNLVAIQAITDSPWQTLERPPLTSKRTKKGMEEKLKGSKFVSIIEWRNLKYEVPNCLDSEEKIVLLDNAFGYARPGDMMALMGPSGAGKSTLLDVIAQKKSTGWISGEILVNGRPQDEFFPRIAGYVEQFDTHVEYATVEEAVFFSAQLRLEYDDEACRKETEHAMKSVRVWHVRERLIGNHVGGGISPELRKKLSIAVELVARPTILFLDEPTTGLDSVSAMAVVDTISDLAKVGLAVICTIHQPSAELFSRFKRIQMLQPTATGGRVSFFGDIDQVLSYCTEKKLGEMTEGRNIANFALEALGSTRIQADGSKLEPADVFKDSKEYLKICDDLDKGIFATTPGDFGVPEFEDVFARNSSQSL